MGIGMSPGSGTGIGFRARFPPRAAALSAGWKVGSGYMSSGILEPVVVRGSNGGVDVEKRGKGRGMLPGFGNVRSLSSKGMSTNGRAGDGGAGGGDRGKGGDVKVGLGVVDGGIVSRLSRKVGEGAWAG